MIRSLRSFRSFRSLRSELRKLTTTTLPFWFLGGLLLMAVAVAAAVLLGVGTDDAEGLFGTLAEQTSLLAFGTNAMMIAGLFGAIAMASEYAHGTIVPTLLARPGRIGATSAQFAGVFLAGAILGTAGGAATLAAGAMALQLVDIDFLPPAGTALRLVAAAALAGGIGAVSGAGIAALLRSVGGAVITVFVVLLLGPPIVAQLSPAAAPWVPGTLIDAISGIGARPVGVGTVVALVAWGLLPAVAGVAAVRRRDAV